MDEITEKYIAERKRRKVVEDAAITLALFLAGSMAANVVLGAKLREARRLYDIR